MVSFSIMMGHAKSKDLVYWEHLPLALKPSHDKGESHCFSGCCLLNKGTPMIIYTSIGPDRTPTKGAEQWLAIGDSNMINWKKYVKNPVMAQSLINEFEIIDWRDPFIWKEDEYWYLILGGHLENPIRPLISLYRSQNLYDWEFIKTLRIEDRKKGKNWECPNFFKMNENYILIVSPHDRVIYSIGSYNNFEFKSNEWNILDYGKLYYATNGIIDKNNRLILWAWIKARGSTNWNGCLTLPRILSTSDDLKLNYKFPTELRKLRLQSYYVKDITINNKYTCNEFNYENFCIEIKIELEKLDAELFYIKLTASDTFNKNQVIGYDIKNKLFWAGKDKIHNFILSNNEPLKMHIYIDVSILEVIINEKE
ncbi:MAG: glycoside hydrolase family 32 protein, partial [Candidatus Thorarchaeota archaeon]